MELLTIVDETLATLDVLTHAYDIYIDETLRREDKLTFKVPYAPLPALKTEALVRVKDRVYRIVTLAIQEDAQTGVKVYEVEAWARWCDLAKGPWIESRTWTNVHIMGMVAYMISGTPWMIGAVAVPTIRSLNWEGGCNRLAGLRQVEEISGVELVWDTLQRTVSLWPATGTDYNLWFLRGRNLRTLSVEGSTADTIYRLHARGQGGLTFATINNGLDYVEVSAPYQPPASALIVDERFTTATALLEHAQALLAQLSTPRAGYQCSIIDLSAVEGADEVPVKLGDMVNVYDEDLGLQLKTRVVRMHHDIAEPWNTAIELSAATLDTADLLSDMQRVQEVQDKRHLAPWNTLLQSVDFYDNGMITIYEDQSRYRWLTVRDAQGRITSVTNTNYNITITVRYLTGPVPPA